MKENTDECPQNPPTGEENLRQLLYLRVSDGAARGDITDTEQLEDIMIYLFDRQEQLLDTIPYTTAMVSQGIPVDLTGRDLSGGYVSVWANLGNSIQTDPVLIGKNMDDMQLRMLTNDSRADYFLCPGDIFFGHQQIAFTPIDEATEADTVWIQRKNSRLHITVRGLVNEVTPDEYYFRMGALFYGYNFQGTPQEGIRYIREDGEFDLNSDYVSPEPYIMIHDAPGYIYSDNNRLVIEVYRAADTRTDTLIASGDKDTDGDYIKLEQGKTTNVLIVLDQPASDIEIHTVITPWEEIYQWAVW
ncbi:MAG: FimB/Mfa2 family fimbrial subunit [Rikenellaceae bacterium]|nr:FimB/Mfa2 family fimbrial subunit [Rikenellaceae bacterium]